MWVFYEYPAASACEFYKASRPPTANQREVSALDGVHRMNWRTEPGGKHRYAKRTVPINQIKTFRSLLGDQTAGYSGTLQEHYSGDKMSNSLKTKQFGVNSGEGLILSHWFTISYLRPGGSALWSDRFHAVSSWSCNMIFPFSVPGVPNQGSAVGLIQGEARSLKV